MRVPKGMSSVASPAPATPAERRREARHRRILRLHRDGRTAREIAEDARVKLTPRRVRQVLRAYGLAPNPKADP